MPGLHAILFQEKQYGRCIVAKVPEIERDMCLTEFPLLKNCMQKTVLWPGTVDFLEKYFLNFPAEGFVASFPFYLLCSFNGIHKPTEFIMKVHMMKCCILVELEAAASK
ncbi:hypothetical protein SAY86_005892 [Trapa natans]|uniref:Uncharacterized protein n=1 Tax=Trapa natans TaxID=22666 RepID=A0AAN7L3Q2_TRANT|nr:hypothetical protein SAY86_005892 [Trapa natans]